MEVLKYGEKRIEGMANFVRAMSQYFKDEAQKYGFAYFEIDSDNFESSIENVIDNVVKP